MKDTQRTARHRGRGLGRLGSLLLAAVTAVGLTSGTAFGTTTGQHSAPPASSHAPHDPISAVAAMQPSWNLGNTMDAIPDETSWGNPLVTKALFDTLRANGFHSVRMPVTWSGHQLATAPYTIDPAFLSRLRQVIDWALSDGLYIEINVHHDSWQWIADMATNHDTVLARFDAIWRQVATEFRDEPAKLLFESINEPQFNNATDAQKTQFLNELNTSFDAIVRRSGGGNATRLLVLPTLGSTPSQSLMNDLATTMSSLHDHNLVATVHYYSFWPFSVNIAGFTRFDATVQKDMTDTFTLMHDTFVAKGIPVFLGEYGLLGFDTGPGVVERGETLKYFEALGHQARVSGVTTALWDNGFFLDRTALQWRDPGLFAEIRSSWTTRSGTASLDSVFVPKSGPITAATLTLNLNGTTFRGLRQGHRWLVAGRDYTVSGSQLTLTARALTRLTGARNYGIDATLQAHFSRGVPWPIDVITYDPPVVSGAIGTTSSFAVPTRFQGDRLATMEAVYADGTNAGPANWTSFQQFGATYSPDYTNDVITLTPGFLNTLTDGAPVTLTFHFWSGATVTYQVSRSGTSVAGTTS
jgi:endoglucanase